MKKNCAAIFWTLGWKQNKNKEEPDGVPEALITT
jgi:hypothetical protein